MTAATDSNAPDPNTMLDLMPFTKAIGAVYSRYSKEEVKARLDWAPELCTVGGVLHGGAVMSLADSTGAACAFLNLPDGAAGTTTVESKTNFLRGVRDGYVEAVSRPLARRPHGRRRRDRRPRPAGPPRGPGAPDPARPQRLND